MQLIQFKPHFHVEIFDCEQLVLFSEDKHHLLQGSIYVAIAELIHSTPMPEATIIEILLPKFPLECIQEAFSRLKKKGFLSKFCNKTAKNILAFWSDLALDEEVRVMPSIVIKNFSQYLGKSDVDELHRNFLPQASAKAKLKSKQTATKNVIFNLSICFKPYFFRSFFIHFSSNYLIQNLTIRR